MITIHQSNKIRSIKSLTCKINLFTTLALELVAYHKIQSNTIFMQNFHEFIIIDLKKNQQSINTDEYPIFGLFYYIISNTYHFGLKTE